MSNSRPLFTVTLPNGKQHIVEADTPHAAFQAVHRAIGTPIRFMSWAPFRAPIVAPESRSHPCRLIP